MGQQSIGTDHPECSTLLYLAYQSCKGHTISLPTNREREIVHVNRGEADDLDSVHKLWSVDIGLSSKGCARPQENGKSQNNWQSRKSSTHNLPPGN